MDIAELHGAYTDPSQAPILLLTSVGIGVYSGGGISNPHCFNTVRAGRPGGSVGNLETF